ncbi:uncharacterized protein J3D65DRAFT_667924 [Phyllosticta citribraziliensis]|uniref:Uncharacterized protein n=1 Tax=Phyllosticta citribraziliensis TaxID=989973 RepID=A0ABR1LQ03_9PEZI
MKFAAFLATIFAASMATAVAIPEPEAAPAVLEKRCIARGVECINDLNNCCSPNVCAMNKGLGTLTCGGV